MPSGFLSLGRPEMPSIDRNDDPIRSEQGNAKWATQTTTGFPRQMLGDRDTNSHIDAPFLKTYQKPAKSRNMLELISLSGNARTPKPVTASSTHSSRNHPFQTDSVMSNLFYIIDRPFEPSVVPGAYRHKTMKEPESTDDIPRLNAQRQVGLLQK